MEVFERKDATAGVACRSKELAELALPHGAVRDASAAHLRLKSCYAGARYEVDDASNRIRAVFRRCAIGEDVDMVDDAQRDIGYVVEGAAGSAGTHPTAI